MKPSRSSGGVALICTACFGVGFLASGKSLDLIRVESNKKDQVLGQLYDELAVLKNKNFGLHRALSSEQARRIPATRIVVQRIAPQNERPRKSRLPVRVARHIPPDGMLLASAPPKLELVQRLAQRITYALPTEAPAFLSETEAVSGLTDKMAGDSADREARNEKKRAKRDEKLRENQARDEEKLIRDMKKANSELNRPKHWMQQDSQKQDDHEQDFPPDGTDAR